MAIQVKAGLGARIDRRRLQRVARACLVAEGCRGSCELGISLTDDRQMRALHARYLAIDSTTDVLSFAGEAQRGSPTRHLGDIVISYPQARRQARAVGHPVAEELDLLLVHGLLHLLGYDDRTPRQRRAMWKRQSTILSKAAKRSR